MDINKDIRIKKYAALLSLLVGILMFTVKTGAYFLTNSAAILSDALESVVHIIATGFMFYSLLLSLKPADRIYPYGYGKIEYFSVGFEGALIIIAAFSIIFYAVKDLVLGSDLKKLDVGMYAVALTGLINFTLGHYLVRTGKKTNSLILTADGKHVLTDSFTSLGVLIGIIFVIVTDIKIIDPLVALAVALNILFTGRKLLKDSIGGLMNRMDMGIIDRIAAELGRRKKENPDWIDIHLLRYWKSGDKYNVDFHITLPYYVSVKESHDYNAKLHKIFKEIFNTDAVDMIMHIDPCKPPSYCSICRKSDCTVRQSEFRNNIVWDSKKIISLASIE